MRIEHNGLFIYFNDHDEVENLRCVCGHTVFEHASPTTFSIDPDYRLMTTTSQCVLCGFTEPTKEHPSGWFVCERFRIEDAG